MKYIISIRAQQLFLVFIILYFFSSCNKTKDGYLLTENGLKYKFISETKGEKPSLGDRMIMHILYKTERDSILFDSSVKGDSFTVLLVAPTYKGGVEEGFSIMSVGDSAIFKTPADSIFEKTFHSTLPSYLKKGESLFFQVKLKAIIPQAVYDSTQSAMDIEFRRQEFLKIDSFLVSNNMDVMPTENGVYLSVIKPGKGESPLKGDTIFVTYTGKLMDGTIFDQSVNRNFPFSFVLGKNSVIAGWEEVMPMLQKGSVAKMLIPSDLAYGAQKYGDLPGYSSLLFDVEVLDIKKGNLIK